MPVSIDARNDTKLCAQISGTILHQISSNRGNHNKSLLTTYEKGDGQVSTVMSGYVRQKNTQGTNLQNKREKTTAPRIPAWSPTVVLTGRHPG